MPRFTSNPRKRLAMKLPMRLVPLFAVLAGCAVSPDPDAPQFSEIVISDHWVPFGDRSRRPGPRRNTFVDGKDTNAFFFIQLQFFKPGSRHTWQWRVFSPGGEFSYARSPYRRKVLRSQPAIHFWYNFNLAPSGNDRLGRWRVQFEFDGKVVRESTFLVQRPKHRPIETSAPSGAFDGRWQGTMKCGTCTNCSGPLTKEVEIDVRRGRFEIGMDLTYHGEGSVDETGNIRIYYKSLEDFWPVAVPPRFEFDGKLEGGVFHLDGMRGARQCSLELARPGS